MYLALLPTDLGGHVHLKHNLSGGAKFTSLIQIKQETNMKSYYFPVMDSSITYQVKNS